VARYRGPREKLNRREGVDLMLKGERRMAGKGALERRNYPPGEWSHRSKKPSPFGLQLREKQKAKRIYGVLERQFRRYFKKAIATPGVTGTNLLHILESRLDNVVYRMGFASTRAQARQFVGHGHILVDGKRVNIPSYQVKVGQLVSVKPASREMAPIMEAFDRSRRMGVPVWIQRDEDQMAGNLERMPTVEEIQIPVKEQMIVELYSR
jgi:small subunit ribosomal protein S4